MTKFVAGLIALALSIGAVVFFFIVPARVDRSLNRVVPHEPFEIGDEARLLHGQLRLADLHDDALLWDRNFLKRNGRGHTDAPRLSDGGYRLQVLAAVTKTPKKLNYDRNTGDTDNITLLSMAQRWPPRTWSSLTERALFIAQKLRRYAAHSDGGLRLVRTRGDLSAHIDQSGLNVILATEGAHPLEGDLANIDRLYDAGYRVLGLQHFFDNELGGSLHGVSGGGLTEFGRAAVEAAIQKGMIIDVAHSSEAVVKDVLALTDRPFIVSHTGLRGHCNSPRNFPDDLMREIAAHGGIIGVGFWDGAVCEPTVEAIVQAIIYATTLVGPDHVALGSDFDGATTTPFDASEAAVLTDGLIKAGVDDATIRSVMGENAIRFFSENLPSQ
jgi:microsomal dipeptidase-like Zn-dependent dipeptidase